MTLHFPIEVEDRQDLTVDTGEFREVWSEINKCDFFLRVVEQKTVRIRAVNMFI